MLIISPSITGGGGGGGGGGGAWFFTICHILKYFSVEYFLYMADYFLLGTIGDFVNNFRPYSS